MKYSLCHATLDTSYHSAVAVHCFMDFVPSLSFLLPSHVYHTRLPSHNSSSRCKKSSSSLFRTKNVRLTSDKYDTCNFIVRLNSVRSVLKSSFCWFQGAFWKVVWWHESRQRPWPQQRTRSFWQRHLWIWRDGSEGEQRRSAGTQIPAVWLWGYNCVTPEVGTRIISGLVKTSQVFETNPSLFSPLSSQGGVAPNEGRERTAAWPPEGANVLRVEGEGERRRVGEQQRRAGRLKKGSGTQSVQGGRSV